MKSEVAVLPFEHRSPAVAIELGVWLVASQLVAGRVFRVVQTPGGLECDCPTPTDRKGQCWHIEQVAQAVNNQSQHVSPVSIST